MPNADLTLDGVNAIVDGNCLAVRCWDVTLDAADRRSSQAGKRRALVHGFSDELVVNYNKDYPGGVTIRGDLRIPEKIVQDHVRLEATDLHIDHPARRSAAGGERRALVHGFNDELVLNWARDYPGGIAAHGNFEVQKSGTFRLRNTAGDAVAEMNASGNLILGGNGQDGDVICRNVDGQDIIHLNGQEKTIEIRDAAGKVRVRIDGDHFTSGPWPKWPLQAAPPAQLDLIAELRLLKAAVLALSAEVEALKVAP